jgi:hypothetical protein
MKRKKNIPACQECGQSHRQWEVPGGVLEQHPFQLEEIRAAQVLMSKINSAPALSDERIDGIRELGEHILRHTGPHSMIATHPRWRAILLNKFVCFRVQTGAVSKKTPFTSAARRRFRAVARDVVRAVRDL